MTVRQDKFKVGDKVNCVRTEDAGFAEWQNCTVVEVHRNAYKFKYSCICPRYGLEQGLFSEDELELAEA